MSSWYKVGSITVTNGSTTVTGSGTAWILNAAVGEALYAPDGRLYEVTNIASDTAFTIAPAYLGATAAGQDYVIVPSQSYIRDLAAQAADLVNQYSTIAAFAGQGKFGDGTLSAPGIRYSDDLDTGFFRSAANEVTFVAGGVAQFKYNASGVSFATGGALVGTTATQTLTNKTIAFASNTLTDVASTNTAQTLTNKTLTSPAITTPTGIVKGDVGLGNVDNTSDATKNSATATLTNKTLTSPVVNTPNLTGGTINNATIGATTPSTVASTNLSYTGTLTGGTGVINIGSGQVFKDASGNVGLGTITPARRLDVNGSIQANSIFFTGSLRADGDGTAASPSILPGNDNDTGFFRPSGNTIGFSTGGTERARIDASGKILAATGGGWVGTVSQSGQSSIVERGSNANGEFVKFADGTLICNREDDFDTTSTSSVVYDYPANYVGNPSVSMSHQNSSIATVGDSANVVVQRTGTSWRVRTGTAGASTITITLTAIGRWY